MSVFGEAEFWLSGGKVILMFILFAFTFITMAGGNPKDDAYWICYWNNPGHYVAQAASTEALGKFEGFLSVLVVAAFIIVGPDYISMSGANPRIAQRCGSSITTSIKKSVRNLSTCMPLFVYIE